MRIDRVMGVVAAVLAACDSGTSVAPDSAATDATLDANVVHCWPAEPLTPRGTAELGADGGAFEALGDELALEYGASGGFFLTLRSRMTGFAHGNSRDILDPENPFTRIRGYFVDSGQPLNRHVVCGYRYAYEPHGQGFQVTAPLWLDLCWDAHHLIGQRVRIELEIADATGGLATDERTVTLTAPPEGPYPIDEAGPGCEPP